MARIELRGVEKSFDGNPILRGVSLCAEDGEFLVLVGPSGCGKSTLLRTIAGLEELSGGEVWIGDRRVDQLPPRERDLAMVFQSYALYPHMTVADNLAFGLTVRKTPRAEVESRVAEVAAMLGLEGLLARFPRQLSGGQRQRVAMGRALVRRPKAFLFDEPLSNLDATLRGEVRVELKRLHAQLGATMVYVTHDQVEAMTLATRIAVLKGGVLMQHGTPAELYGRPANQFVASFIGSPPMNFFNATVRGGAIEGEGGAFVIPPNVLALSSGMGLPVRGLPPVVEGDKPPATPRRADLLSDLDLSPGYPVNPGHPVDRALRVGVRAHDFTSGAARAGIELRAVVDVLEPLGPEVHVHARVKEAPLTAVLSPDDARPLRPGSELVLGVDPARIHLFDAATQERVGA